MLELLGETVASLLNTLENIRLPLSLLITVINITLLSMQFVIPTTQLSVVFIKVQKRGTPKHVLA